MKIKPFIGQKVSLNDTGLEILGLDPVISQHMKTLEMLIVYVEDQSMTDPPEETWIIEVDNSKINECFLISQMFDEV